MASIRGSSLEHKLLGSLGPDVMTELNYHIEDGMAIVSLGGSDPDDVTPWNTKSEEHRLEPRLVLALFSALDRAEEDEAVQALVVTAEGRFWSNGFDLKVIPSH